MTELLGKPARAASTGPARGESAPEAEAARTVEPVPARQARLRRRRRLLLWGLPLVVAASLVAAKLLGMNAFAQQAIWRFGATDPAGVNAAADGMGYLDLIETHKSHFARGDAAVLAGDWPRARSEFEEALRRTGARDECTVRVNLVLTIEKLGDAAAGAGDAARAAALYADGEAVVAAAPSGCFDSESPQNQLQQGDRLGEAKERMEGKRGDPQQPGTGPQPSQPPNGPEPSQPGAAPSPAQPSTPEERAQEERLKDLERKSQAGAQERSDSQQRKDYLDTPPSAPVDRPW